MDASIGEERNEVRMWLQPGQGTQAREIMERHLSGS
jgi:hypothetical protein